MGSRVAWAVIAWAGVWHVQARGMGMGMGRSRLDAGAVWAGAARLA